MTVFPAVIKSYLNELPEARLPAFLEIDNQGVVLSQGGALEYYNIDFLNMNDPVFIQLPFLEGIFCYTQGEILPYMQLGVDLYANLHVVSNNINVISVLFVDVSYDALRQQEKQQQRLSVILKK